MCRDMLKTKKTQHGKLTQKATGLWSTNNKLNWKTPSWGLPECCQWHHYEATNYFLIPARVYKRHDTPGFESSAADVSKCPTYFSGECQLRKKALIWEPNLKAKLPTHLLTADLEPTDHEGETGYVMDLRRKLRKIYDAARDTNRRASAAQKLQHDKHVNPSNLQSGEEVF